MSSDFVLMRHAESLHNLTKSELQAQDPMYKDKKHFRALKYDLKMVDPKMIVKPTENNLNEYLSQLVIKIIIVSPLRRSIQTALIVRDHLKHNSKQFGEQGIPIVVEPYLSSRFCSAWSLGTDIRDLMREYEEQDLNWCHFPEHCHWGASFLTGKKEQVLQNQTILDEFKQGKVESFQQMKERVQKLKLRLQLYQEFSKHRKGKVLVISHSCLMSALCSEEFSESGKSKIKIIFNHLKPILVSSTFRIESKDVQIKRKSAEDLKPKL